MMKNNLKAVLSASAGVFLITAMLGACTQAGTSRAPGQNNGRQLQNMQTQGFDRNNLVNTTTPLRQGYATGINLGNNQGTILGMNQATRQQATLNQQKADTIKRQLINMNGVESANVIVMGNTALVGFKPTGNTRDATAVRNRIMSKVKAADKTITNVSVSESPDIMGRMNRLSTDITSNRPINAITDEFNNIIRGITPVTR